MMRRHNIFIKRHGFALIELVILVILIGVLVAIALADMSRMMRRYKGQEAVSGLQSITAHMKLERSKTGVYNRRLNGTNIVVGAAVGNVPGLNAGDLNGNYFRDGDYSITSVSANGFTAQATGDANNPQVAGITITINESGTVTENGY